jgi:hypothetical protein
MDALAFQQQMMGMMNLLTQSIAALSQPRVSSPTPASTVSRNEPKVKEPETFHGSKSDLSAFITECHIIFELQPSSFLDDQTKVGYMVSLLRDAPLAGVRPLLKQVPRLAMFDDYDLFLAWMRRHYGDPNERGTARRKLKALWQTTSASAYLSEFQQYITILGWQDQEPIIDKAIEGLRTNLKDEIVRQGHNPNSLADLIEFIIPLDNRLYEQEQEKKREDRAKGVTMTVPQTKATVTTTASKANQGAT